MLSGRDELCPTAGPYLTEMSRISRFKSRHQEMDNASYLDMPQTAAGTRPRARREPAAEGAASSTGLSAGTAPAEAAPEPQKTQTLP